MTLIQNLEKLLTQGSDNATLRFGLGNAYFQQKNFSKAIEHLQKALQIDPNYSAAWKLYAKALEADAKLEKAIAAYEQGISIAEKNGDLQAAKEMQVFLKRLKI